MSAAEKGLNLKNKRYYTWNVQTAFMMWVHTKKCILNTDSGHLSDHNLMHAMKEYIVPKTLLTLSTIHRVEMAEI